MKQEARRDHAKGGQDAINRVSTEPLKQFTRYYPPEWERQKTAWLSWPHNEKEWGKDRLGKIREFYKELISVILNFQDVHLIFPSEGLLHNNDFPVETLRTTSLKKIIIPNNDIWIRDYGPFFLEEGDRDAMNRVSTAGRTEFIVDFQFNAWGGKFPPWDLDNKVPKEIALYYGMEIESYPLILEGGALEFSGDGVILTTEECLLNKNRNKDITKEQIELVLKAAFNIEEIIWLKNGLVNDHTDGHVDNVARFIGPRKVLVCKQKNNENINILKTWRHFKEGSKLEIVEIPLPETSNIKLKDLPCSYANFIFVNGGIIVPIYNCRTDDVVLKTFQELFPGRKVIGIDCSLLIQEGGGIHCMTKQEPTF